MTETGMKNAIGGIFIGIMLLFLIPVLPIYNEYMLFAIVITAFLFIFSFLTKVMDTYS